jgi:hypothetical protein
MFTKIVIQLKMKKKIKLSARRMPFVRTRTAAAHATSTIANTTPPTLSSIKGSGYYMPLQNSGGFVFSMSGHNSFKVNKNVVIGYLNSLSHVKIRHGVCVG